LGGEKLRNYETVFILDPTIGDDRTAQEVDRAKSAVESANGEMIDIQRWGKRKLAYEIKKKREGVYTVFKYRSDGTAVSELERSLRLSEPVLRFLTVQDDVLPVETKDAEEGAAETAEAKVAPAVGEVDAESSGAEPESSAPAPPDSAPEPESPQEEPEPEQPEGEVQPSGGETSPEDTSAPEGLPKP
jgi:small subunit ribosomal protein S6